MAQEVDLLSMIGLKSGSKDTLEGQQLFVADARQKYAYEDNQRTDKVIGTTVTLQVVRDKDNLLSSHVFDLTTDQVLDPDNIIDKDVNIEIDDVSVWASTRRNSTYAEPKVTLHGKIVVE